MNNENSLVKKTGKILRKLIEEKGITQAKAAEMLNIDERTLRNWLKDGFDKLSTVELISKVFEVNFLAILSE